MGLRACLCFKASMGDDDFVVYRSREGAAFEGYRSSSIRRVFLSGAASWEEEEHGGRRVWRRLTDLSPERDRSTGVQRACPHTLPSPEMPIPRERHDEYYWSDTLRTRRHRRHGTLKSRHLPIKALKQTQALVSRSKTAFRCTSGTSHQSASRTRL